MKRDVVAKNIKVDFGRGKLEKVNIYLTEGNKLYFPGIGFLEYSASEGMVCMNEQEEEVDFNIVMSRFDINLKMQFNVREDLRSGGKYVVTKHKITAESDVDEDHLGTFKTMSEAEDKIQECIELLGSK